MRIKAKYISNLLIYLSSDKNFIHPTSQNTGFLLGATPNILYIQMGPFYPLKLSVEKVRRDKRKYVFTCRVINL